MRCSFPLVMREVRADTAPAAAKRRGFSAFMGITSLGAQPPRLRLQPIGLLAFDRPDAGRAQLGEVEVLLGLDRGALFGRQLCKVEAQLPGPVLVGRRAVGAHVRHPLAAQTPSARSPQPVRPPTRPLCCCAALSIHQLQPKEATNGGRRPWCACLLWPEVRGYAHQPVTLQRIPCAAGSQCIPLKHLVIRASALVAFMGRALQLREVQRRPGLLATYWATHRP